MTEIVVQVNADPGVWFTGPHDPAEGKDWAAGALEAVATDFGLSDDDPARDYLLAVLTTFATTDLGTLAASVELQEADAA